MNMLWESMIDPATSDVALYIFGFLILLCLAVMVWNKVYEWKQKWKKRRSANRPSVETHDHIPSTALDAKRRLEQLESLKTAGLITDQEYRQKRSEIIKEL